MKKIILSLLSLLVVINTLSAKATKLDHKWINKNYVFIKNNHDQLEVAKTAYRIGHSLIINGESYEKTLAAIALVESSLGRDRIGDHGNTFGLTHFSLDRAREIIDASAYLNGLKETSDDQLKNILQTNDEVNMILCGLNFKLNFARFKSYVKAIKAHNGYIPGKFNNKVYYEKIINAIRVIKKLKKNNLI